MIKWEKTIRALLIALIATILCEFLVFNFKAVTTIGSRWQSLGEPETAGGTSSAKTLIFHDINSEVGYVHLNIAVKDSHGQPRPTELTVYLRDQGNAEYYRAGTASYTQEHPKGSYFRINAYGAVKDIKVQFDTGSGGTYTLESADINGSVPLFVSPARVLVLFLLFALLYALRPSSVIYGNAFWDRFRAARRGCVALLLAINVVLLGCFAGLNDAFVHPVWEHHQQYAKLARALADGKTYIETPEQEQRELVYLAELDDPYDRAARKALFDEKHAAVPWDAAYYNGHLYVYFGVVPVVVAYLPYYLATGNDLPTFSLAVVTFAMILAGAFVFMRAFVKRYFPDTPFALYVMLSLLLGNGTCAAEYTLVASFYIIPITFATAFTLWALGLWLSAARRWDGGQQGVVPRVAIGSVFAALVAGCRPQFLVFSLLALPIFWGAAKREWRQKNILVKAAAFAAPYVVVAGCLMYYNAIRFGSVFDFGANYNLTTNNMPLRGWKWSRLPDGFFEYLFRLPNIDLQFPFIHAASTGSPYVGMTIREPMFGGVLITHVFLWMLLFTRRARGVLRQKRLWGFVGICALAAVAVIAADTEIAGILWRYTGDFLPLLYLAAIAVFLSLYHRAGPAFKRGLKLFLVGALCVTVAACLLFSVTDGRLWERAPENYYMLKDFFC
ncbi:MAG: hypothetical protein ACOYJY_05185 [Acutalibacteraceae bacterium]|jgi:hypothetical protein